MEMADGIGPKSDERVDDESDEVGNGATGEVVAEGVGPQCANRSSSRAATRSSLDPKW